jgi:uncharacterized damage-inducible protein DinB
MCAIGFTLNRISYIHPKSTDMTKNDLPFLPHFFDRYIHLASEELSLTNQLKEDVKLYTKKREELLSNENFRYLPDKWTVKQLFQHVIDTEKILVYRALCISRGEQIDLPGFEEDDYAQNASASERNIDDMLEEFEAQRESTIRFFQSLSKEMLFREGNTNGIKITPLALGFVIVGHPRHHLNILSERYF